MSFNFKFEYGKSVNEIDKKIIVFILEEKTNIEMAEEIGYSLGAIKKRLAYLFKIYNVKTKVGLVREYIKNNGYKLS